MTTTTLTGLNTVRLMRISGITIRGLSARMGITQGRVRSVRKAGVRGSGMVRDWCQGITGRDDVIAAFALLS